MRRLDLNIGISYESDLKKAKEIIANLMENDESVLKDQDRLVVVDQLADSAVVLSARSWVKTEEYWTARWRLLEEIKLAFDEQGIEIPYQHMTVQMKATAEN